MAAARPLMKCCKSTSSGAFKLDSLSCCNSAVNTSPQKMSSFCQVKDGEDVLQIPTVGKWPMVEREAGHYQATTRACSRCLMCPPSGVEDASAVIFSCLGFHMGDKTAFQPGTLAPSEDVVLVFFRWLEGGFLVLLWKCKLSL